MLACHQVLPQALCCRLSCCVWNRLRARERMLELSVKDTPRRLLEKSSPVFSFARPGNRCVRALVSFAIAGGRGALESKVIQNLDALASDNPTFPLDTEKASNPSGCTISPAYSAGNIGGIDYIFPMLRQGPRAIDAGTTPGTGTSMSRTRGVEGQDASTTASSPLPSSSG